MSARRYPSEATTLPEIHVAKPSRAAEDFPRVFRCDEHAQGLVTHPVAWGAEDMRALSALAFPPDAGTLTSAEADELRRQGDG